MSLKVLVADGSNRTRKNIVQSLHQIGVHDSVEATDSKEAISLFKQDTFGIVLTDWNLQDENGKKVIEEVRQINKEIPIIATSNASERDRGQNAMDAGATDFLVKPFTNDVLRAKLNKYIDVTAS